ncbi:hypothetical protein HDU98_005166 [Podochytrium sp. JEL0797]|nr:hypothetical protein HDU98_005166 [Podochytrium sp. JEL0797]
MTTPSDEDAEQQQPLLAPTDASTGETPENLIEDAPPTFAATALARIRSTAASLSTLSISPVDCVKILLPTFAVFLIVMFYVYIPLRLQSGAKHQAEHGHPPRLNALAISDLTGDAAKFTINLTNFMDEKSPLNMHVSPSRFTLDNMGDLALPLPKSKRYLPRIPASWTDQDSELGLIPDPVCGFQFDGFVVPAGAAEVNFTIDSQLDAFDAGFLDPFLSGIVGYLVEVSNYERNETNARVGVERPKAPGPVTLRQRFASTFWFPVFGFWKWEIPNWQYHRVDLSTLPPSTNNTDLDHLVTKLNVTLDDKIIEMVPIRVPGSSLPVLVYVMNLTLSFTDPTDGVLTVGELGTTVYFTVAYEGVDMLDVWVKVPAVTGGRNVGGLSVDLQSVAEDGGTGVLMEWFGKYADGEDTRVSVHSFGFEYAIAVGGGKEKVGRLGWIERMVRKWAFEVFVAGAKEEMLQGWGVMGWAMKTVARVLAAV